ncbi:MAG: DUF2924 domain-containing protein [Planctomycetota bacterium]
MPHDFQQQINELHSLTPKQLRDEYHKVWGEPSRSGNKRFLIKRIAWRIQADAEGDLPERVRRKALAMARDSDLRTTSPVSKRPPAPIALAGRTVSRSFSSLPGPHPDLLPGSQLTRLYKGTTVVVDILEDGFAYQGQKYRSLSATAKAITGSHCSGYAFFGLKPTNRSRKFNP